MRFKVGDLVRARGNITKEELLSIYIGHPENWDWMLKGLIRITHIEYDPADSAHRIEVTAVESNPHNLEDDNRCGYLLDHMVENARESVRKELQMMKGELGV